MKQEIENTENKRETRALSGVVFVSLEELGVLYCFELVVGRKACIIINLIQKIISNTNTNLGIFSQLK